MVKGKEAGQSRARPEDKGKEATLKAKESEPAKPQAVVQEKKATDPPILPPVNKKDPPLMKAQLRIFLSFFVYFFFLVRTVCPSS